MQANRNDAGSVQTVSLDREHRDSIHREIRVYVLSSECLFGDLEMTLTRPGRGAEAADMWPALAMRRAVPATDRLGRAGRPRPLRPGAR